MKLMQYTVVLEKEPDGGFIALVPVLPGCVSQGETRDEALANIREAAELHRRRRSSSEPGTNSSN